MAGVLLWVVLWIGAAGQASAGDITIGMSAVFSGASRGLGIELYRGSAAYFQYANHAGLLPGIRLALKAYDDGYQPGPAVENTMKLIEDDGVFLLFNYVGTPTMARVLPLFLHERFRQKNAYLFFPFTGAEFQREPPYSPFVFNLRASYREETFALVDRLLAIGRKRIAVFYQADAYGRSGWDGVRTALASRDMKIVGEATYRRGAGFSEDFSYPVDLLKTTEPDAVICIGVYAACAGFIRDARRSGWRVPIANLSCVDMDNLLALLRNEGDDALLTNLIFTQVVPSYENTRLPAVVQYRQVMQAYDPRPPDELCPNDYMFRPFSFVSLEGFLNAKLLVHILSLMGGDLRRSRLAQVTESLRSHDLGIGIPVSFGPDRHQGLHAIYFFTLYEGNIGAINSWERWKK